MKLKLITIAFSLLLFAPQFGIANDLNKAVTFAAERFPELEPSLLVASEIRGEKSSSFRLFSISTMEAIPSPTWTVAVPKTGKLLLLQSNDISNWNRYVRQLKTNLAKKEELIRYVRTYLKLTNANHQLLHEGRAKSIKRARSQGVLIVQFNTIFANGIHYGWRLQLKENGEIIGSSHQPLGTAR